jgi:hypothetical protein
VAGFPPFFTSTEPTHDVVLSGNIFNARDTRTNRPRSVCKHLSVQLSGHCVDPNLTTELIIIIIFIASGVGLSPLYCGHFWPIVQAPDDRWGWLWSNWWNEDWQGKQKYSEKTYPNATFSTTNPTWPDPGSNLGHRGEKPATNRLSYGVASRSSLRR